MGAFECCWLFDLGLGWWELCAVLCCWLCDWGSGRVVLYSAVDCVTGVVTEWCCTVLFVV